MGEKEGEGGGTERDRQTGVRGEREGDRDGERDGEDRKGAGKKGAYRRGGPIC